MYSNFHHRVSKVFYNRQCLEVRVRNLDQLCIRHTYTKPVLEYQYYTEPLLVIPMCYNSYTSMYWKVRTVLYIYHLHIKWVLTKRHRQSSFLYKLVHNKVIIIFKWLTKLYFTFSSPHNPFTCVRALSSK